MKEKNKAKKVIMTGPTGAIGIALVQELVKSGAEVTAICHRGSKRIKRLPESDKLKVIERNLDELKTLEVLLDDDYDIFYHLGWSHTVGNDRNDVDAQIKNIKYTIDAVELANAVGCNRFIGAGSQAEYGRTLQKLSANIPTSPENGYGMAKLCAGQMSRLRCEQLGMEHIWTRILSVYGPYDGDNTLVNSLIRKLKRNEIPHCTKGEQIWDYLYSKDAARALYLIGEMGIKGKVYCIGSGQGKPLLSYIETIRNCVNPNAQLGIGDVPYGENQVMHLWADISDLENDVGFEPRYSFEQGVQETIHWIEDEM